jgi:peptide/nickel transport system permease protein
MNAEIRNQDPSAEHIFGTDKLGRDVFSRSMLGGRVTIVVTLIAIVIAMLWGGLLGIVLGLLNGRADELIMRLVDALLSIPWLLMLLLIISVMGTEMWVQALTFGFTYGILTIRVARAATLDFVTDEFILAARARGERKRTIVIRELLPNVRDVFHELVMDAAGLYLALLPGIRGSSPHARLGFHDCEKSRDSRHSALGSIWTGNYVEHINHRHQSLF